MQQQKIRSVSARDAERILHLECNHNVRLSAEDVRKLPPARLGEDGPFGIGRFWACPYCPDKAVEGVTLSVMRKFFSFTPPGDLWERVPYERVVWTRSPEGDVRVTDDEPLDGYCRGLLVPFIDGRPVTLAEFDAAMETVHHSRAYLLPAIEAMNVTKRKG